MTGDLTKEDKDLWERYTKSLQDNPAMSRPQPQHSQPHETKIDLHGMTMQEAHDEVLYFLESCYNNNVREVIVITGHGDGETSIKREFQFWVNKPEFAKHIISYNIADRRRGGEGAFIVRIKKK